MHMHANELNHFHEQGFVVLKDRATPEWREKLKKAAQEIVANWDIENPRSLYYGTPLDQNLEGQAYLFESLGSIRCFFLGQ